MEKSQVEDVIGISFSPIWPTLAIVDRVSRHGLARGIMRPGDIVASVNGDLCQTAHHAARMLRESTGRIRIVRWHAKYVTDIGLNNEVGTI